MCAQDFMASAVLEQPRPISVEQAQALDQRYGNELRGVADVPTRSKALRPMQPVAVPTAKPLDVDRWRREEGLPFVKVDGLVLFRPEALREWAAQKEAET